MAKVNEIIDLAQSQVGTKESPPNSNNVKYNTWYYGKAVSGSSYPWCAVFISWLFNQIDNSLIKKSASCMTIGQWFKDNNMWFTTPKVGDVVFFKFNTNKRWTNHVGIVKSVNLNGSITTIEGNTSTTSNDNGGSVMERVRKSNIVGYGRPKYETETNISATQIKAIDLSHHNTITSWDKLSNEIKNVIIRVGYRGYSNGILTLDKKFDENMKQAESKNMNIGVYLYDQSINENEAIEQANWVIDKIKKYTIKYPIYIDSEYANKSHSGRADSISKEQRTKNIVAFCNQINKLGYTSGVYASNSWFKSMVNFDSIKNYEIWCARYSTNKPTISKYEAWQYGSENFAWATANIDVNYFYKDYTKSNTPKPNIDNDKWTEKEYRYMVVCDSNLYYRKTPFIKDDNKVNINASGTIVNVVAITNNNWYKLDNGYYMSSNSKYSHIANGTIFNCNSIFIRSSANSNTKPSDKTNNIIGSMKCGDVIKEIIGLDNGFYMFKFKDKQIGYISAKFINIK